MEHTYDVIAIGDIVTDAFIRLKDAEVHCNINTHACELCLRFGDKVPFESVTVLKAVGNSPNGAVSASRLGLRNALIATVGQDQNGTDCLDTLKSNNVSTEYMRVDANNKTNYHYVLWYTNERTILVKHEKYEYKLPEINSTPKWIYLSSMGKESAPIYTEIAAYLKKNPEVKLAFQPGTFQMELGTEFLKDIYESTELFICNVEESQRILKTQEQDIKVLLDGIKNLGPKIVCITDGPKGAYMLDNGKAYFMPIYPDPKEPFERTGCGDAFASTFMSALLLGKTPLEALVWAPINPMSVVQYVGAQEGLLSREQLETLLKNAPADYQPKEI
jgi:sugar/nucleoside kinase (ribokinase family)